MFDALKDILLQPLIPCCTVKSFNVIILSWLSRLDVKQCNLLLVSTLNKILADILWSVVATKCIGFSAPLNSGSSNGKCCSGLRHDHNDLRCFLGDTAASHLHILRPKYWPPKAYCQSIFLRAAQAVARR